MFVKKYVGSLFVGGYGGLSESGLCIFRELCPVSFLVVGESPSSCRMLILVIKGKWCVLSCPRRPVVQCVRHRGDIW